MRLLLALLVLVSAAQAEPVRIQVFVALADNQAQGILPVPAKIGNGNDPANNLYWGCSEALPPVFKASGEWKRLPAVVAPKASVLERVIFRHRSGKWEVVADAYRGTAIQECISDFFAALTSEEPLAQTPLVAYIGHDGLMDFPLPAEATAKRGPGREAIVLCCKSADYFGPHLAVVNAKPLLLTTQLMYPGGFLLKAALEGWIRQESVGQIRQRAAAAYAKNQGISVKAAAGVFAELKTVVH